MPRSTCPSRAAGWRLESLADAVLVIADDPQTDHEGVTFLVREEGTDRLLVVVVGDDDEPTPVTQAVMDDWEYLVG